MTDFHIEISRIQSLQDNWGVMVTKDGKIRIPVCYYDDVLPLLTRKRPGTE